MTLIEAWYQAHQAKLQADEAEKTLRLQVAETVFGYDPNALPTGSAKTPLPQGFACKIQYRLNESLKQSEVDSCRQALLEIGEPEILIAKLFRPKFETLKSCYNLLTDDGKLLVDSITTRTSGLPCLEIVSPKGKKQ